MEYIFRKGVQSVPKHCFVKVQYFSLKFVQKLDVIIKGVLQYLIQYSTQLHSEFVGRASNILPHLETKILSLMLITCDLLSVNMVLMFKSRN